MDFYNIKSNKANSFLINYKFSSFIKMDPLNRAVQTKHIDVRTHIYKHIHPPPHTHTHTHTHAHKHTQSDVSMFSKKKGLLRVPRSTLAQTFRPSFLFKNCKKEKERKVQEKGRKSAQTHLFIVPVVL